MLSVVTGLLDCPEFIVTDWATAFTASEFEQICKDNQMIYLRNATATPRANGQVEQSNSTRSGIHDVDRASTIG